MDLRQLRYLVALADEQHFTRAAERLGIAQPALSQQIRRLEAEVGLTLVERTTRRVEVTAAGDALVYRARRILREVADAQAELQGLRGLRAGRLVIGVTQTPGPVDIDGSLAAFHASHPGVELAVREALSAELAQWLRGDLVDVALLTSVDASDVGLELRSIARERLVAVVPPGHPLARAKPHRISVAALRDEDVAGFREGATIRDWLQATAAGLGFRPTVAFEAGEVTRIRSLVHLGLAVSVLPYSDAVSRGPEVAVVELDHEDAWHEVFVGWRAGRPLSPAARAFVELVSASAGTSG